MLRDELPVAVPADDNAWSARVLARGADGSGIEVVGVETAGGLTIATHRKTGWRHYPSGQSMAADPDLQDTARHAVNALLDSEEPAATDAELRRRGAEMIEESGRLAGLVFNQAVWPARRLEVDGESFALFVTTRPNGQAAVADLGPVRLVISGPSIPEALTLRTVPLKAVPVNEPSA